ncbi:zinc finger HIT domain-containing protein [Rhodotorula paludigena]|uniref:zinc finger HIT domain-containing protein n=1 Tax=Rhodotorula paludigena TaxID=86838 RepID=UPI00317C661D
MPAKLPPCKVCGKSDSGKYTCPTDHVPYCTVACFKQHKQGGCFSSAAYEPPPRPIVPAAEEPKHDDDRPRKRLKDLHWPAEPDPTLWDDPLQRDDLKPLRHSELEALATSPQIRSLLARPSILTPLTRLLSLPHHARTASLRTLLGLPAEPAGATYRPEGQRRFATSLVVPDERGGHGAQRGRGRGGARGGRGGGGRGADGGARTLQSTEEERKEVERFAAQVLRILEETRAQRR